MGTKMAVSSANIFMSAVETEIISLSNTKPPQWKRYIDGVFSLWSVEKKEIEGFVVLANRQHSTIKFTAEISDKEVNFLDTTVFKGDRFNKQGILDRDFPVYPFLFLPPTRGQKRDQKGS